VTGLPIFKYTPPMLITLYQTPRCPYAELIASVAAEIQLEITRTTLTQAELTALPWGNYERSPVLVERDKVIEDWRAIVRYLDEEHGDGTLTALPPLSRARLFDLCEEVDKGVLVPAALIFGKQPSPLLQRVLQLFSLETSKQPATEEVLPQLQTTLKALRTQMEPSIGEFKLLRCIFNAADAALR
jgi:glutathione S-transferase